MTERDPELTVQAEPASLGEPRHFTYHLDGIEITREEAAAWLALYNYLGDLP